MEIRIYDTILAKSGQQFCVIAIEDDQIICRDIDTPNRKKTFQRSDDLHCLDREDGLWIEL